MVNSLLENVKKKLQHTANHDQLVMSKRSITLVIVEWKGGTKGSKVLYTCYDLFSE